MENRVYKDIQVQFTNYIEGHKLRKTEERYRILQQICTFPGHFDIQMLHKKMEENNFHVSKATVYNTLEVLEDARLIVRHQFNTNSVHYELRVLAENHLHLICNKCGVVREVKNQPLRENMGVMRISKFTTEFFSMYIFGICSKCKYNNRKKTK